MISNKDIVQAKEKKYETWWDKHYITLLRILFWYIYLPLLLFEKIEQLIEKQYTVNDKHTEKYLDKAFLGLITTYSEDNIIVLFGRGRMSNNFHVSHAFDSHDFIYNKCAGRKANRYFSQFKIEDIDKLVISYEIKGYTKIVINSWLDWEHAKREYNIKYCGDIDNAKAVIWIKKEG